MVPPRRAPGNRPAAAALGGLGAAEEGPAAARPPLPPPGPAATPAAPASLGPEPWNRRRCLWGAQRSPNPAAGLRGRIQTVASSEKVGRERDRGGSQAGWAPRGGKRGNSALGAWRLPGEGGRQPRPDPTGAPGPRKRGERLPCARLPRPGSQGQPGARARPRRSPHARPGRGQRLSEPTSGVGTQTPPPTAQNENGPPRVAVPAGAGSLHRARRAAFVRATETLEAGAKRESR